MAEQLCDLMKFFEEGEPKYYNCLAVLVGANRFGDSELTPAAPRSGSFIYDADTGEVVSGVGNGVGTLSTTNYTLEANYNNFKFTSKNSSGTVYYRVITAPNKTDSVNTTRKSGFSSSKAIAKNTAVQLSTTTNNIGHIKVLGFVKD